MESVTATLSLAARAKAALPCPTNTASLSPGSEILPQQRMPWFSVPLCRRRVRTGLRSSCQPPRGLKETVTSSVLDDGSGNGAGPRSKSEALDALDRQLDMLAKTNGSATRQSSIVVEEAPQPLSIPPSKPGQAPSELPKGSAGFAVFLALALMALTIVTNILFTTYVDTEAATRPPKPAPDLSWRRSRTITPTPPAIPTTITSDTSTMQ